VSGEALQLDRRGHGPALMLLHGYTGSGRSMASVAQAFEREYEVLVPDLPGHGRSPAPGGCSFEGSVDDLLATLDATGHSRAHWLGYSMGARLALGCAVRRPECISSLILVAGRAGILVPQERAARRRADEALAVRIERDGVEAFVDEWMAQPLFATQRRLGLSFLAQARSERLANSARGLADCLRGIGLGAQPPLFDSLSRVTAPTLCIAGALDTTFVAAAQDLARRLPCAELCVIAEAGHAVHLEQPMTFVGVARDFLRRAACPARSKRPILVQETAK